MATSLIDPDCIIPGVNNNLDFVAWLTKDKRIKFHNVLVKESPLGGIGLFYNSSKPSTGNSELLRIKLKYDYTNLLEKLNKLSPGNSAIVKLTLSTIRPSTETSILQSYFIAFKICTIINGIDNDEVLGDIVPYLNILCNTKVDRLDLTGSSNTSSRFLSKFNRIEERQLAVYEELMNALKEEKYQVSDDFKFEDYKQIEAVIRSRVLEIPTPFPMKMTKKLTMILMSVMLL